MCVCMGEKIFLLGFLALGGLCVIVATGVQGVGCSNNSNNNFSSWRLIWFGFFRYVPCTVFEEPVFGRVGKPSFGASLAKPPSASQP